MAFPESSQIGFNLATFACGLNHGHKKRGGGSVIFSILLAVLVLQVSTEPLQYVLIMGSPSVVAEQRVNSPRRGGIGNIVDIASDVEDVMRLQKPSTLPPLTVLVGGHNMNSTGFPLQTEESLPAEHLTKQTNPTTSIPFPEEGSLGENLGSRSTLWTPKGNASEREKTPADRNATEPQQGPHAPRQSSPDRKANLKSDRGRRPEIATCEVGLLMVEGSCVFVEEDKLFDFIVVGCGAVGCPMARTLADAGKRVLVLERGKERTREKTPHAVDIFGAGRAVADETVAQLIQTNQGVRSQTAGVMGGGTSINMGIVAMETSGFFEYLNEEHGWRLDMDLLNEAQRWISKAFKPMPQDTQYVSRLAMSLQDEGYKPLFPSDERAKDFNCPRSGLGCTAKILPGHVWGGVTVFDKEKNFFRNAADVFVYEAPGVPAHPDRLLVKTEQFVERVLFATSKVSQPRAVCVSYRPSSAEDMAPIGLDAPPPQKTGESRGLLSSLLSYALQMLEWIWPNDSSLEIACLRGQGEIILSAGAVHTPLLLFRSGVGPQEQLQEIGVPAVAVVEELGRNLSDRILIPIQMFQKDNKRKEDRNPRVCQVLGARHQGPHCDGVGINERTLKCSLLTTEELSGPNVIHGLLWASHLLLPPSWRDHPAAHAVFNFVRFCEGKMKFQGTLQYPPACMFVEGLLDCLDRSISLFYFTTEPKSRGYIRQHKDGRVEVEANYLKNEQDLFDATRGVQSLIQQVNGGRFADIVEPLQPGSCPVLMLYTVVSLFLDFAQAADLPQYEKQLLSVRRHSTDLQTHHHEQARATMPSASEDELPFLRLIQNLTESRGGLKNEKQPSAIRAAANDPERSEGAAAHGTAAQPVEGFEEDLGKVFKDREKLKRLFENGSAQQRRRQTNMLPETTKQSSQKKDELAPQSRVCAADAEPACKDGPIHSDVYTTTCSAHDIFTKRYGSSACSSSPDASTAQAESPESFISWQAGLAEAGIQQFFGERLPPGSGQWAATYPPVLPQVDDPEAVAAFAVTYMTSIWHLAGTAAVGHVVDHEFRVMGTKNLSIADASVLNQMTRLNPTATLLTLGRYIGLLKVKSSERNTNNDRKSGEHGRKGGL